MATLARVLLVCYLTVWAASAQTTDAETTVPDPTQMATTDPTQTAASDPTQTAATDPTQIATTDPITTGWTADDTSPDVTMSSLPSSPPPSSTIVTGSSAPPTSTTPSPQECGTCDLGATCSVSCGQLALPATPQEGSPARTSVLRADPSSFHLELKLDTRSLHDGERLSLTDNDPSTRTLGPPSTVVSCLSNMASGEFVYKAKGGVLTVVYSYENVGTEQCPSPPPGLTRNLEFNSKSPLGATPEDGVLQFPAEGQLPPSGGGEWSWSVPVTEGSSGFGVNVTLESAQLDASLGDFLTVNPGLQIDASLGVLFSWTTEKKDARTVRFMGRDSFYAHLTLGARPPEKTMEGVGFKIKYSSFDPVTTPPPTTTTTTPLPTRPDGSRDTVLRHVGGVTPEELVLRLEEFQESIANLSNDFCFTENIKLRENVTWSDVLIESVSRCPDSWPSAHLCVAVVFAVPAKTIVPEEGAQKYQLTELNLARMWMWLSTGNSPTTLPQPMTTYSEPQDVLWWWIGITLGVLVLVILLIITAWRVEVHHSTMSYSKKDSLMGSGRGSDAWGDAAPLPHQVVPPYLVMDPDQNSGNGKLPDLYSDQNWGSYDDRGSYSTTGGMVNHAYEEEEEDEEIDIFGQRNRDDDFGSEDEIVQTVGPPRHVVLDPIYDTPSIDEHQHIKLNTSLDDHLSETVL